MVSRRNTAPVLIFDLDGTLLSVNSYPLWARRLAHGGFPHLMGSQRLAIAGAAIAVLGARRLRLFGHDRAKWRLQSLWQRATRGDGGISEARLCDELLAFVRPEFKPILGGVRMGAVDAVLATAAAEDYAVELGRRLGFSHIIAGRRPVSGDGSPGERKLRSLMAFLAAQGWQDRSRILFTDHPDDLPLIRCCATVFWFGTEAHCRVCREMIPGAAIYPPSDERFASLSRSLGAVPAVRTAVAARSRSIAS